MQKQESKWVKKEIDNFWAQGGHIRYEEVKEPYTIDVNLSREQDQFKAASNQVNVFSKKYGGWLLGTPKNFPTIMETVNWVAHAKRMLDKGKEGKKVPFPL